MERASSKASHPGPQPHRAAFWRVVGLICSLCPAMLIGTHPATSDEASPASRHQEQPLTMDEFLDRLMMAESGGRRDARNPRSTALGPFQFISSTFLDVMRRNFADEIAGLSDAQVLELRTSPDISRRAALVYVNESAALLNDNGLSASWVNLRLAFLVGARGAVRLIRASSETPLSEILGEQVLSANPFMSSMKAADLVRKAALDVSASKAGMAASLLGSAPARPRPVIQVRCKLGLASCRHWLALQKRKYPGADPLISAVAMPTAPR